MCRGPEVCCGRHRQAVSPILTRAVMCSAWPQGTARAEANGAWQLHFPEGSKKGASVVDVAREVRTAKRVPLCGHRVRLEQRQALEDEEQSFRSKGGFEAIGQASSFISQSTL